MHPEAYPSIGISTTFRAVINPCTQSAQAPDARERAIGIDTAATYIGLLKSEFEGGTKPKITARAERKVTIIQLRLVKGAISMRMSPSLFRLLTSLAVRIGLQYFAMHLHHP